MVHSCWTFSWLGPRWGPFWIHRSPRCARRCCLPLLLASGGQPRRRLRHLRFLAMLRSTVRPRRRPLHLRLFVMVGFGAQKLLGRPVVHVPAGALGRTNGPSPNMCLYQQEQPAAAATPGLLLVGWRPCWPTRTEKRCTYLYQHWASFLTYCVCVCQCVNVPVCVLCFWRFGPRSASLLLGSRLSLLRPCAGHALRNRRRASCAGAPGCWLWGVGRNTKDTPL